MFQKVLVEILPPKAVVLFFDSCLDRWVSRTWRVEQMRETYGKHPALIACQNSFMVPNYDKQVRDEEATTIECEQIMGQDKATICFF